MNWTRSLPFLIVALIALHRQDDHLVWVNTAQINTVQGAGQLGYPTGTLVNAGGVSVVVKENVSEVIRAIRAAEEKK